MKKWMQVGAAGILSFGVLAACGDDMEEPVDDADIDMNEEAPIDQNDDGMENNDTTDDTTDDNTDAEDEADMEDEDSES
ncbi:hypothetical protein [Jeotgalibacillus soli]|nr:hypothetical protein [Jeotgalibacillus soli]